MILAAFLTASSVVNPTFSLLPPDPMPSDTATVVCPTTFELPPAGVMGPHAHADGHWMFAYRYSVQHWNETRDGTDHLSAEEVFAQGFAMAPTSMTMEMHMLDAMYGVSDRLALSASVPYVDQTMHMKMDTG